MNANEFKAQERAKNEAKFGRWASTLKIDAADPMKLFFEQAPRNELEAAQHGNALANTGNYPVGTSECFNVGISGGCGPDCFVYMKGQCGEPQEMLPGMDADGLKLHAELYGHNAEVTGLPLFGQSGLNDLLGGILEKTMETNHYKTTAYAIRIGDEWFAGFGGKPGQESLTKVRPGLCDAKLVWDDRKAAAYVERLRVRGYAGEIVKVTA